MTKLNLTRPLASIDLETTGVDVNKDRIVQIAVVVMSPDGSRDTKSRTINPGMPIPKEASDVHGITDDQVEGKPEFGQVAKSLHKLLSDVDITGYNVRSFDVPLLTAEFRRAGIMWPAEGTVIVDAFEIFKRQVPHKLSQALEFYTGELLGDDAHDAEADAVAALNVLEGQAHRYGDEPIGLDTLVGLGRDPDWLDETGKVKWQGDTAVINFGKWVGVPMQSVDQTYFDWVVRQEFPDDFKQICLAAKKGDFPSRGCL